MTEKEKKIIEENILGNLNIGYAYLYSAGSDCPKRFVFEMTPKNIANFIGANQSNARKMILTDVLDCLILDTVGGLIMTCPDQALCWALRPFLIPIQMGEKEAEEVPMVSIEALEEYYCLQE